jgi:hypothetical protein
MLVPEQCRRATALQRKGLLLKEIAAELEVSFEDVALYLFGGIADWTPIAPARRIETEKDQDDDRDVEGGRDGARDRRSNADEGRDRAAVAAPVESSRAHPAAVVEEPTPADRTPVRPVPEPRRAPPAPQPHRPPQPAPQPAGRAIEAAKPQPATMVVSGRPAAPAREIGAVHLYYLTDEGGQWLHEGSEMLTKNKRYAGKFTTKQIAAIVQRAPKWRVLVPERVPG